MRGDPSWVVLCRDPRPAPCPQTPWNKCVQNQLGFFFNAWRPRLAFLCAGVQGPLPVLRLLVTRWIFRCFCVQNKPKNLNNNMYSAMRQQIQRNRYICPCTRIRIYVLADERALCRAPSSFWFATSPSGCFASSVDRFVVGVHRTPSDNPGTDLPARSPAGMASSDLLPSDLKRPGLLKQPVSGCIVSVRERSVGAREGPAQSGAPPQKGKGKARKASVL